jgi:hypothetical protein
MQESMQKKYGKFGKARKEYLEKWHPEQYKAMVEDGTLEKHLAERQKAAQGWVNNIFEYSLKRYPFPSDNEISSIVTWVRDMSEAVKSLDQMAILDFIKCD